MPCLGLPSAQAHVSGCDLLRMRATIPAADVPEHEHDEAHVVLTLRGTYLSDANGMPTECGEPALVLNPPGTDDWYIVYHRRPLGVTNRYHRETCIERMHFTEDGHILPVTLTVEGVPPRPLTPSPTPVHAPVATPHPVR